MSQSDSTRSDCERCGGVAPMCPGCIHAAEDARDEAVAVSLYLWAARNTDAMIGGTWEFETEEFKDVWREDAKQIIKAYSTGEAAFS